MRAFCPILFLQILLASSFSSAHAQDSKPDMRVLAWISGCWENSQGISTVEERWTKLAGESMLGVSRTVKAGKTVAYEFIRIMKQGDDIYYVACPSGQKEAQFKLAKWSEHDATFENPDHDFPQRIVYRKMEDGSLHARIEGTSKGKERGVDFHFQRITCD